MERTNDWAQLLQKPVAMMTGEELSLLIAQSISEKAGDTADTPARL